MKREKKAGSSRIFEYVRGHYGLFASGILFMLVITLLELASPLIIMQLIDNAIPNKDGAYMLLLAGAYVVLVIGMALLTYAGSIVISRLGLLIVKRLKRDIFSHMLTLPVAYFDKHRVGELMSRVESDCERVRDLFSRITIMLFTSALKFAGMYVVLSFFNFGVSTLLILPVPLLLSFVFWFFGYLRKYYDKSRKAYADICGVMTEYVQGIEVVKAFNRTEDAKDLLAEKSKDKRNVDVKASILEYGSFSVLQFILGPCMIGAVVLLLSGNVLSGVATIGSLFVFIDYGQRLFEPLFQIAENIRGLQQARVSLKRIFSILDLESEAPAPAAPSDSTFASLVEFKDVSFRYKDDEPVLQNVSFTIGKGETVALVGPSGSGKTTTVSLLCRFYEPQEGAILVDGKPLSSMRVQEWRRRIGLVLQDIYLFPGTVLENVRVYNEAIEREKVFKALDTAHATDFVGRLSDGVDTEITEGGTNISMGEKQLLSFARAIAFDPELVVMDEATASIDVKTERRIQESMRELLQGRTALIVAHRLTSILNADKIIFFKDGRILAQGTHQELLSTLPEYAELVRLQFPDMTETEEALA
jgi:ATP-binding cassette subfamily B protein